MKKQYLFFTNPEDVYNNFSIICYKENLNQELIEQELLEPGMSYTQTSWVIFEDGIMIQG
jgi:hypothetical protein